MRNPAVFAERFWSRVSKTDGCWLWTGTVGDDGYATVYCPLVRTTTNVHRVAWMLVNGPVPDGLQVCHTCDVRHCVRPEHLWLGTAKENHDDMVRKGRHVWWTKDGREALQPAKGRGQ